MGASGQRQQVATNTNLGRERGGQAGVIVVGVQAPSESSRSSYGGKSPGARAWQRRIGSLAHRAFLPRFKLALPHLNAALCGSHHCETEGPSRVTRY
jgi:hypothetical protein